MDQRGKTPDRQKKTPPGAWMSVSLWVLCVVRWKSLRRADHSSRGVLPNAVCLSVIVKPRQWGGPGPLLAVIPWKKYIVKIQTNFTSLDILTHLWQEVLNLSSSIHQKKWIKRDRHFCGLCLTNNSLYTFTSHKYIHDLQVKYNDNFILQCHLIVLVIFRITQYVPRNICRTSGGYLGEYFE